jgi:hypothetical protein
LTALYCGTLDLLALGGILHSVAPVMAIYPAYSLAIAWIAADKRRRCPVCLRRLSNPARVGQGAGTLLGYCATELVCLRGHGLIHIPEFPTIALGDHPKPANDDHLKTGQRESVIRDIDPDARDTLRQREQCLERWQKAARDCAGPAGLVASAH